MSIEVKEFDSIKELTSEEIYLFKSEIMKIKKESNQKLEFSKYTKLCQFLFGLNCLKREESKLFDSIASAEEFREMLELLCKVDGSPSPRLNGEMTWYKYINRELNKVLLSLPPQDTKNTPHLLVRKQEVKKQYPKAIRK